MEVNSLARVRVEKEGRVEVWLRGEGEGEKGLVGKGMKALEYPSTCSWFHSYSSPSL